MLQPPRARDEAEVAAATLAVRSLGEIGGRKKESKVPTLHPTEPDKLAAEAAAWEKDGGSGEPQPHLSLLPGAITPIALPKGWG